MVGPKARKTPLTGPFNSIPRHMSRPDLGNQEYLFAPWRPWPKRAEPCPSAGATVPSRNFTVRPGRFEAVSAAGAAAPVCSAATVRTVGMVRPNISKPPVSSRRFSLPGSSIFTWRVLFESAFAHHPPFRRPNSSRNAFVSFRSRIIESLGKLTLD